MTLEPGEVVAKVGPPALGELLAGLAARATAIFARKARAAVGKMLALLLSHKLSATYPSAWDHAKELPVSVTIFGRYALKLRLGFLSD